jgi:hypothetical protein
MLDHDDLLAIFALQAINNEINKNGAEIIYYDEDIINELGERYLPIFKQGWAPETLLSQMYLAHCAYKLDLVKKLDGFRKGYEGSQDYDLALRAVEVTEKIAYIPLILYHWRAVSGSTAKKYDNKNYAHISAGKAVNDAIKRRGLNAKVIQGATPTSFRVKYL